MIQSSSSRTTTRTSSSCLWLSLLSLVLIVSPLHAFSSPQNHLQGTNRRHGWAFRDRTANRKQTNCRRRNLRPLFRRNSEALKASSGNYEPLDADDANVFLDDSSRTKKGNLIEVRSQIELPFSAEVAYDAYSDLPRQATWSSWLESVQVLQNNSSNNNIVESLWTSKMFGIKYSWKAVAVKNERPHTIQWKSTTGLRNEGIVRFYKKEGTSYEEGPTLMTLKMAFVAPRAVSAIIRRSKKLTKYVEEQMIAQSLEGFREIVLEKDVREQRTKSGVVATTLLE